ncbi:MAG: DUF58 domain-containing protein [Chitinophagales bacterium]|nr:DUF58 domain-containing protein [Saprospirales bacterium]MBK8350670.1 DUF58 domain-containing protein [Saprospirales bacterium]MBP6659879.1 DUF58 domain-containing protein [Chitinophagales bacterium]
MQTIQQQDFFQFDKLDVLARQVVEGFIIGLHKSPYHGFSVEFAEHRLHNVGDSIKDIDWKVFARTEKLYTKKFEEETNLRCQIVIDASSSMYFPQEKEKGKLNKIEFSCLATAALLFLLRKQRDAVGLTIFDNEIKTQTSAKTNALHQQVLLSNLYQLLNNTAVQKSTNAAKCLHQIADSIHKRSLVFIFSDMLDSMDENEIFLALQHLKHSKHEVVLFHVIDKSKELDFNFENRPYKFIDLETNEELKLQPNQVKEFYVEKMNERKANLKLKCAQYKIDFVEADINEGYHQILLSYLVKRSKMI